MSTAFTEEDIAAKDVWADLPLFEQRIRAEECAGKPASIVSCAPRCAAHDEIARKFDDMFGVDGSRTGSGKNIRGAVRQP